MCVSFNVVYLISVNFSDVEGETARSWENRLLESSFLAVFDEDISDNRKERGRTIDQRRKAHRMVCATEGSSNSNKTSR